MTHADILALLTTRAALDNVGPWKLRLFVSLDVVGSTAFKQRVRPNSEGGTHANPWLKTMTEFYPKAEVWLREAWLDLAGAVNRRAPGVGPDEASPVPIGDPPVLWKAIGDEAVFCYHLRDLRHSVLVITIFRDVLHKLQTDLGKVGLTAKATAWLAGFPVTNSEIVIGSHASEAWDAAALPAGGDPAAAEPDWFFLHFLRVQLFDAGERFGGELDFLGPQVDLGFRLAKAATPRRFVVSLDLASLLARYSQMWAQDGLSFDLSNRLHFDDTMEFKGILGGIPYPVFWLDAGRGPLPRLDDDVRQAQPIRPELIVGYHDAFVAAHRVTYPWLTAPFVMTPGLGQDGGCSTYHRGRYDDLCQNWRKELERWRSMPPGEPTSSDPATEQIIMSGLDGLVRR